MLVDLGDEVSGLVDLHLNGLVVLGLGLGHAVFHSLLVGLSLASSDGGLAVGADLLEVGVQLADFLDHTQGLRAKEEQFISRIKIKILR